MGLLYKKFVFFCRIVYYINILMLLGRKNVFQIMLFVNIG